MKIYTSKLKSPFGIIYLASSDDGMVQIGLSTEEKFVVELNKKFPKAQIEENNAKNQLALQQLKDYFSGKRNDFSVPLKLAGTEFQKKVWNELLKIPYGQTITYGEIAKNIGNPKAVRAVGLANNRNPVAIIVPCHRVIGANGKLVGYGGGLDMKESLLKLEGALLA